MNSYKMSPTQAAGANRVEDAARQAVRRHPGLTLGGLNKMTYRDRSVQLIDMKMFAPVVARLTKKGLLRVSGKYFYPHTDAETPASVIDIFSGGPQRE